eukprot:scaffold81095_cov35-Tisochrysis_lutea.AAC.3
MSHRTPRPPAWVRCTGSTTSWRQRRWSGSLGTSSRPVAPRRPPSRRRVRRKTSIARCSSGPGRRHVVR